MRLKKPSHRGKMMRFITIYMIAMFMVLPHVASANEFGDMFYNQTPAGMADYTAPETESSDIAMDEMAKDMQDIMPAAGEEEVSEKTEDIQSPE